jgi:PST family polysaccharide transporter
MARRVNVAGARFQAAVERARMTVSESQQRTFDRRFVHGVGWTAAGKWSVQIITWGSLLILARLLSPADYGLVGMAAIFLNFALLIAEFGIGAAIVVLRDLSQEQIRQINMLALLIGAAATLAAAASAPLLASIYDTPALLHLVPLMSLNFVLSAFRTVPLAVLQRDMQFKYIAFVESVQAAAQAIITVLFAFYGAAYWSLVAGALLSLLIANGLLTFRRRIGFQAPQLPAIRGAVTFSWQLLASRVAWYLYSNADYFVVGKVLGKAPLGAYTLAFTLASMPLQKITVLIMRVITSVFSAVKDDSASIRRYVRNVTEMIALATFPVAIGLAVVGPEIVPAALGGKWGAAILPLQILACSIPFRSISGLPPQVLIALGDSRRLMKNTILTGIVMPISFLIGTRWGMAGVATVWVVIYPICVLPLLWVTLRRIGMSLSEYYLVIQRPLLAVSIMFAALWLAGVALPAEWPVILIAAAKVLLGALVYAVSIWRLYPAQKFAAWEDLIRRSRGAAPAIPGDIGARE